MGGFCSLQLSFLALIPCPSLSFSRGNSGGPRATGFYFNTGFLPGLCHSEPGLHLLQKWLRWRGKRWQQLGEEWIVLLPFLPVETNPARNSGIKGCRWEDSISNHRRGEVKGRRISFGERETFLWHETDLLLTWLSTISLACKVDTSYVSKGRKTHSLWSWSFHLPLSSSTKETEVMTKLGECKENESRSPHPPKI